jgi:Cu-Zn family superoxide dismutase
MGNKNSNYKVDKLSEEECVNAICVFDPNSSFNKAGISGTIKFYQRELNEHTTIKFNLSGFKPNSVQGIHIHEKGNLTEGCNSLCAHYNPFGNKHGSKTLWGDDRHVGDLINNIKADNKGNFVYEYQDDLVDISGPFSVIGRSIVIHEKMDDGGIYRNENTKRGHESATTGNAGSRVACSIIGIS